MSQTVRVPPRQRMQRQGTVEALLNDGLDALETAPLFKYQADWRLLLEKLENLATSSSSSASKPNEFVSTESGVPIEPVVDDTPRRILREAVAYLQLKDSHSSSANDVELAKYKTFKSRVDKYSRKSMLSTATSNSSPPTMASDKGSTSSLSVPAWEQDLPSPSPLKFTFTRISSTNSFALDVFPDEPLAQQTSSSTSSSSTPRPLPSHHRYESPSRNPGRMRSDTVPKALPHPSRSRSTSFREKTPFNGLQRIAIDENSVHESPVGPMALRLPFVGPKPPINSPSKHRHSRSLPALRAGETQTSPPPVRDRVPPQPRSPTKSLKHSVSMNEFVNQGHLFLGGGYLPVAKSSRRPTPPSKPEPDSQARWTIHDRDSWEVVPPVPPTKSPRHSTSSLPPPSLNEPRSLTADITPTSTPITSTNKPKGLGKLRKRLSKSNLSIKTGALASIANIGSPKLPDPTPVNVNAVVLGPSGCGVTTLIRKFVTGSNEWIPGSTIDDFWHHVVKNESRNTYYNITEVTGADEYVDLRRAVLRRAQVVLLCFRLDSRSQFRDAIVRLVEDIHTIGEIPIVLVGTFQDSPHREVSADEAQTAAEALHASYFECSPLLGRGVQELFAHVATVLQTADQLHTSVTSAASPTSATRHLFNLVRGRRSFSGSSSHTRSHSHYVTHSTSSRQQFHQVPHSASARQQTFADAHPPSSFPSVLNIAPGMDATPMPLIPPQLFKCVIHGGDSSGKKSLVHRYLHGLFEWLPEAPWMTWKAAVNFQPTPHSRAMDHERRPSLPHPLPVPTGPIPYALSISEAGAARGLDSLRRATYAGVNVFVICFSVSDYREEVMQEIRERWYEECKVFNANIPVVVVGTKIDQRAGTLRAWTTAQGQAVSRSIRAAAYLECSALTGEGVEEVFQTIIRVANDAQSQSRF